MLQDIEALDAMVNDARIRSVRVAGKSHPSTPGEGLLQQISQLTADPRFTGKGCSSRIRHQRGPMLVQGGTSGQQPRRPLEACCTAAKTVLNGGLNMSYPRRLLGESYDGQNGFAIGRGEVHSESPARPPATVTLCCGAPREVVPLYYDRDGRPAAQCGLPDEAGDQHARWRQRRSDVKDYVLGAYIPAAGGTSRQLL